MTPWASSVNGRAPGADQLYGDAGDDTLNGGDGNDRLVGGLGDDLILGGAGDDVAVFNTATDGSIFEQTDLGDGMDVVIVNASQALQEISFELVQVGNGAPHTAALARGGSGPRFDDEGISFVVARQDLTFRVFDTTSAARNPIGEGGGGFRGNEFAVVQLGTSGADLLDGQVAQVGIVGGPTRPVYLNGGAGDDTLRGGTARDSLVGGSGNDRIDGGLGDDEVLAGPGADIVGGQEGLDRITGGAGADKLYGDAGDDFIQGEGGDDTVIGGSGADALFGDNIDAPGVAPDVGADLVGGGDGDDGILGGRGDDQLYGDAGADFVDGEGGDDIVIGGDGNDRLRGGGGADKLYGGDGADDLLGGGFTLGRAGVELYGEAGNDTIRGGFGADMLAGGLGSDRFVFADTGESSPTMVDRIVDFDPASGDVIDLSAIDANVLFLLNQAFTFVPAFTRTAGQAVLSFEVGSNTTRLSLDTDGDGVADARIDITGNFNGDVGFIL